MVASITAIALAGTAATALMVVGMLALVWLAMDDEHHRPKRPESDADPVAED